MYKLLTDAYSMHRLLATMHSCYRMLIALLFTGTDQGFGERCCTRAHIPGPSREPSLASRHRSSGEVNCVCCHVSCVMCHVSCVMCHVSRVMCHVSCVMESSCVSSEIMRCIKPDHDVIVCVIHNCMEASGTCHNRYPSSSDWTILAEPCRPSCFIHSFIHYTRLLFPGVR